MQSPPVARVVGSIEALAGPVLTIRQFESKHPASARRLRGWIFRADIGMPDFSGLSDAVIRVGRSVMVDEPTVLRWLASRTNQPKSPARNPHGSAGKGLRRVGGNAKRINTR